MLRSSCRFLPASRCACLGPFLACSLGEGCNSRRHQVSRCFGIDVALVTMSEPGDKEGQSTPFIRPPLGAHLSASVGQLRGKIWTQAARAHQRAANPVNEDATPFSRSLSVSSIAAGADLRARRAPSEPSEKLADLPVRRDLQSHLAPARCCHAGAWSAPPRGRTAQDHHRSLRCAAACSPVQ